MSGRRCAAINPGPVGWRRFGPDCVNSTNNTDRGPPAPREAFIATETELRLAARPRDLAAVIRALEARADSGAARVRQLSIYYDTPDLALARQGLALRVRQRDGQFIQTVKQSNDAGDLSRGEWEDRIAGGTPDPAATESGRFLSPEIAPQLVPLFRTEISRSTVELSVSEGTRVEAAVDRGWIRAI